MYFVLRSICRRVGSRIPSSLFIALCIHVVLFANIIAFAEDEQNASKSDRYIWQTRSASNKIYSKEISDLYLTLYNSNLLPVKEIESNGELYVENVLRANGLLYGQYFPLTLDSLMCDLNPQICKRSLVEIDKTEQDVLTNHVNGYQIAKGDWFNNDEDLIVVPDITFEETVKFVPYNKKSTERIDDILKRRDVDCNQFKVTCEKAVALFNPPALLADEYSGKVVLPEKVYKTTIYSSRQDYKSYPDRIELNNRESVSARKLYDNNLNKHLSTKGKGALYSDNWNLEPAFTDQKELFALIAHPALTGLEVPIGDSIMIFDSWVDENHCDLKKDNLTINNLTKREVVAQENCGEADANASPKHHGTHVTSILAADLNSQGMGGVSPKSRIVTHEVIESALNDEDNETHRNHIAHIILENFLQFDEPISTYNFSLGYTNIGGDNDDIELAINALQNRAIFVAAAGNERKNFSSGECSVLPACFHNFDNIITVVGLNRDDDNPDLWRLGDKGSNFSKNFHIGAIAENVLGATESNKVGVLSGTSQAAPQVSGAASMVWSSFRNSLPGIDILPIDIKSRLIYSSDLFPSLNQKLVGGRLNIQRAIDGNVSQIALKDQGAPVKGLIIDSFSRLADGDVPQEWIFFEDTRGNQEKILIRNLKRLIFNPSNLRFTVFHTKTGESKLHKRTNLKLLSSSLHFTVDTGVGNREVGVVEILDYTAPFRF